MKKWVSATTFLVCCVGVFLLAIRASAIGAACKENTSLVFVVDQNHAASLRVRIALTNLLEDRSGITVAGTFAKFPSCGSVRIYLQKSVPVGLGLPVVLAVSGHSAQKFQLVSYEDVVATLREHHGKILNATVPLYDQGGCPKPCTGNGRILQQQFLKNYLVGTIATWSRRYARLAFLQRFINTVRLGPFATLYFDL